MTDIPLEKLLSGTIILDFSHRLPGPFCGKILSDLGADVIKVEDQFFKDPFLSDQFSTIDPNFLRWYQQLNAGKKILRFDFNSSIDQNAILELVSNADALIMGLPSALRLKLNLMDENLKFDRPFVVVELRASRTKKKAMHDLNTLASSGLLSLYIANNYNPNKKIINPPFLPVAGIAFGQKAATDLIASLFRATKLNKSIFTKTYLDDSTNDLLGIFWPENDRKEDRTSYLHNGQYPCYSIYQTKDLRYVALAAVEEKFWNKFCEIFNLKTPLDRFYNGDDQLFELVSNCLSSLNLDQILKLSQNEDLCLTAIV
jgi:crotonobetainyl-CoA:carnitine CoA-transferase CaiB-like acyl-CoA transferase